MSYENVTSSVEYAWRFTAKYEIEKGKIFDQQRQELTNQLAHVNVELEELRQDRDLKNTLIDRLKRQISELKSLSGRTHSIFSSSHYKRHRKHRRNLESCLQCIILNELAEVEKRYA